MAIRTAEQTAQPALRMQVIREGSWPTADLAERAAAGLANLTGCVYKIWQTERGFCVRPLNDGAPFGQALEGPVRYPRATR